MKTVQAKRHDHTWLVVAALVLAIGYMVFQLMPGEVGSLVAPDRPLL